MTDSRIPIEERDNPRRRVWTLLELAQVRERFGPHDTPEALDLFAPNEWLTYYEEATDEDLRAERDGLRIKRARWRAGAEMGFSPGEVAMFGAVAKAARDNPAGPAGRTTHGDPDGAPW